MHLGTPSPIRADSPGPTKFGIAVFTFDPRVGLPLFLIPALDLFWGSSLDNIGGRIGAQDNPPTVGRNPGRIQESCFKGEQLVPGFCVPHTGRIVETTRKGPPTIRGDGD